MSLKLKTICMVLLCCFLFVGLNVPAMAQTQPVAEDEATVILTEQEEGLMAFIRKTNSRDWSKVTFNDIKISGNLVEDVYFINERSVNLLKLKAPGSFSVGPTQILNGNTQMDFADFREKVANNKIRKIKQAQLWIHEESGTVIAEKIVVR